MRVGGEREREEKQRACENTLNEVYLRKDDWIPDVLIHSCVQHSLFFLVERAFSSLHPLETSANALSALKHRCFALIQSLPFSDISQCEKNLPSVDGCRRLDRKGLSAPFVLFGKMFFLSAEKFSSSISSPPR